MFKDIRQGYGLTRNDVARLTRRSVNYVLKAEQATFPAPPIALLDFYARQEGPEVPLLLDWEPMDRDIMRDDYRNYQRRQRHAWLHTWEPVLGATVGYPFRFKWRKRMGQNPWREAGANEENYGAVGAFDFALDEDVYSSQYGLSVGLCLPAAVIYRNELAPNAKAGAIRECMEDLVEYALSGGYAAVDFNSSTLQAEVDAIVRIAVEEGVITHDRANSSAISSAA